MITKIVSDTERSTTVQATTELTKVKFNDAWKYYAIRNDGSAEAYVSKRAFSNTTEDGVISIPAQGVANIPASVKSIYITGSGSVLVLGQNTPSLPFKRAAKGGDVKSISGESSYTITDAVDFPVLGLNLYGKSTQDGIPTPNNPVDIASVGDSGSVTITVDNGDSISATAAITSALPLCGIPVESGGNYTDSNGQQWVCDEFVYNADGSGKIVKHTEKITYDDSYKIVSFSILGNCARFYIYNKNKPYTTEKSTKSMCDFMPYMSSYNGDVPHHYMQEYAIWIFVPVSELSTQDITGATEWLSEKQPTFVYQLAEPQEIPLSAAEMAELRQLMTYSGTTDISNSDNADMDVKYCINQVMADYYPIFAGQGADVQPLVLFEGTDEGYSLADGFTGFSAYYTDTPAGADIEINQGIDTSTESRYGYRIAKAYGISDSGANYTDSAVISSNEEIDLTPYSMLLVDFYGYCDNSQISSVTSANMMAAYFRVDRPDKLPQSHTAYDWTDWDNMGMSYHKNSKYYFDVSQFTGKHYLCFGIYHGDYATGFTNGIKLYKMTLI